jgi:hypothetical protein
LGKLVRDGKLPDIKVGDLDNHQFCSGCGAGKAHQLPYNNPPRAKRTDLGGRVHLDIFGPTRVPGPLGEKYGIGFTDEASSHHHLKLLRSKSEAADEIIAYKIRMENQHPHFKVRIFRTDNAKDILRSHKMEQWMKECGIVAEFSPEYTPQLNGTAERFWRTLEEPTRITLAVANLPKFLWAPIMLGIVHTKNLLPSQAIGGRIPLEVLTGRKADLSHLRILGCDAYPLHKAPGRDKFDPRADLHQLVGYGRDSNAYVFYNPARHTFMVSRDAVFNEEAFIREKFLPYHGWP